MLGAFGALGGSCVRCLHCTSATTLTLCCIARRGRAWRPREERAKKRHLPIALSSSVPSDSPLPSRCTSATTPTIPTRLCAACAPDSCLRRKMNSSSSMRDLQQPTSGTHSFL